MDMQIECWSHEHIIWGIGLGVPMFVFFVVGLPLGALLALCRNRKKLDQEGVRSKFLILYQGLKPSAYFWEIVNIARKIEILLAGIFIPQLMTFYKAAVCLIILVIHYRLKV
jgi:hypothetical protein